ncbi:DUF1214 domain-containing protein [Halopseudomonas sp. SMJS2]|uniref:DUF1254 domain-containing protein n=1 Tax=Halopseudomonas sp. SMJS2 TaxID=3041098 RepID=UPI002452999A|nr:DUF1214 domain-containing protein [Halopseudomonas sp. SMJS2]WGK62473.1 DUF1214 domain-containing protein [Halopseudomonas sp. SMJS2]
MINKRWSLPVKQNYRSGMLIFALLFSTPAAYGSHPVFTETTTASEQFSRISQLSTNADIFDGTTSDPYLLAFRAYIWGYPLVEAAKIRMAHTNPDDPFVKRPQPSMAAALNHLGNARYLMGPEFRHGVGVNNDTIYTVGWFDMSDEPWVLESPDFQDRYYTYSIYRSDSSTVDSIGQRTHGGKLPPVFLYGPHYQGEIPEGMLGVHVSTRYLDLAGRILATGTDQDYAEVHRLQNQIQMRPYSAYLTNKPAPRQAPRQIRLDAGVDAYDENLRFYAQLGNVLRDWVAQPGEASLIDSFQAINLSREGFTIAGLDDSALDGMRQAAADAQLLINQKSLDLGASNNGWTTNYSGSRFDDNYLLRAAVAKDQIFVTIPEEAIYPVARTDSEGDLLKGCNVYRISFKSKDLHPAKGFWSITLYNDQGYMIENSINRYSIGDRTPELMANAEGDVVIQLQHTEPMEGQQVNWLPTPAEDDFYLMMRLYIPKQQVLDRSWQPPAVERVSNECRTQ